MMLSNSHIILQLKKAIDLHEKFAIHQAPLALAVYPPIVVSYSACCTYLFFCGGIKAYFLEDRMCRMYVESSIQQSTRLKVQFKRLPIRCPYTSSSYLDILLSLVMINIRLVWDCDMILTGALTKEPQACAKLVRLHMRNQLSLGEQNTMNEAHRTLHSCDFKADR